jgi:deazaflavin-dependent oxidoreductase (nitroreductase family)
MNPVARKAMAAGNRTTAWLYRRSNGRLGGSVRGLPVLALTVPGRNTGKPRSVAVAYFEHGAGYLVAGTAGGMKTDPQWVRNLRAARGAHIQIGEHEYDVEAREVEGAERDELWRNVVLARAPSFAGYEGKSGRSIPVVLLTRPAAG